MNRKLKVGVVGLSRGHIHAMNSIKASNIELTAVCDIDHQRIDRQKNTILILLRYTMIIKNYAQIPMLMQ